MDFFPDVPPVGDRDEPEEPPQPAWTGPPDDVLPGVVPVELIIGQSESTVVMLTGMRAFPTGLGMRLVVRVRGRVHRRDLSGEIFDGPYTHDMDADWQAGRLKWGFEFADGRRVTNVDPPWPPISDRVGWASWPPGPDHVDRAGEPDRPVLVGGGGGGGDRSADRAYWLWPLPPAGPLRVACQWLEQGIEMSVQDLQTRPFLEAAARARPIWPRDQLSDT
jgi:hypothetical protein